MEETNDNNNYNLSSFVLVDFRKKKSSTSYSLTSSRIWNDKMKMKTCLFTRMPSMF